MDVARPHGEHHVALPEHRRELWGYVLDSRNVVHIAVPKGVGGIGHELPRDTGDWLLTGSIDVSEDNDIGLGARAGEVVYEIACPCIGMGLEHRYHAASGPSVACCINRGADFRRMVGVIVDHQHAVALAALFETTVHAAEIGQTVTNCLDADATSQCHRARSKGVTHIMLTRPVERDLATIHTFHC